MKKINKTQITSVEFVPQTLNDKYVWRESKKLYSLFIIPTGTTEAGFYRDYGITVPYPESPCNVDYIDIFVKDKKLYFKAKVIISLSDGKFHKIYFEDDASALNYAKELTNSMDFLEI